MCDYTSVADLLKQWMPSFKDHATLKGPADQHKSLYNFIGRVVVLRPDNSADFVSGDNFHSMLPDEPGLYKLREPPPPPRGEVVIGLTIDEAPIDSLELPPASYPFNRFLGVDGKPRSSAVGFDGFERPSREAPEHKSAMRQQAAGAGAASLPQTSLRMALLQFMNHPHPLQTLSAYESYGPNGAISRFHNPDNYTKGILGLPELRAAPIVRAANAYDSIEDSLEIVFPAEMAEAEQMMSRRR